MNELISTVEWSRAQFALTAMYHWLFVPLTIGLALIVAIMESIYYRTGDERWRGITRFWMTLFGINFACGVATGIILEFEFGTNWSNYSWFVGDIFGAPLAIEGIAAFFLEATFVAVMFFGWNRVSKRFHLMATWLTAFGVALSAWWILVANSWMQYPAGMTFDPVMMRNEMTDFLAVAFSPVAVNKFFHAVTGAWALAAAFVLAVSCWMIWRKRNVEAACKSVKIAAWVGLVGMIGAAFTGHGSAVEVAKVQPMKLAAMEGLYRGGERQPLVAVGVLNSAYTLTTDSASAEEPFAFKIDIPCALSWMIDGNADGYVPGIYDLMEGNVRAADGTRTTTLSYAERIASGNVARQALADYGTAVENGDSVAAADALAILRANYANFGYAYLDSPKDAVPPVGMSFYSFHIMVIGTGALIVIFLMGLFLYKKPRIMERTWVAWLGMLALPIVYVVSQAGWVLAEVGRQPWVVQDLMPTMAAATDIAPDSVKVTFWIFAALFTGLLIAEICIMLRYIGATSKKEIEKL